jgi:4-hydroxy-3-methylbut-2-en-1-yl diphosphate reductase
MVVVHIDPLAGFCPGVKNAISTANTLLESGQSVFSLDELVHCPEELERLSSNGLRVISIEEVSSIENSDILIRAHGVTPEIQHKLEISNNNVVDATCGTVHRLQQKIKTTSHEMQKVNGQIVIFGKKKHPEVLSLLGYCNNCNAIVVEDGNDLSGIDLTRALSIFAQTTTNVADYDYFISKIYSQIKLLGISSNKVQIYNTICGSIKVRVPKLILFAKEHDIVIFVSGEQSSNGAYLSSIVKEHNFNTFKISSEKQLERNWFANAGKIGVTGSASTPFWLLDKVARSITKMVQ